MKIDGRLLSQQILGKLKIEVVGLKKQNVFPYIYVILLINDPSTLSYIKQKRLKSEEIGAKITIDDSNPDISEEELIKKIDELNNDPLVHGIIVQRPLPKRFNEEKITYAINSQKDIDGFRKDSKFGIPVGLAVIRLLRTCHPDNFESWLKTNNITVIGKGLTAGYPVIKTLENLGIKPNVISSKTERANDAIKDSDIVISCVGKQKIVNANNLKKSAILIGVGMHMENDKLKGDFEEAEIEKIASFYSPTPGGVGPVNVSCLLVNLLEASKNSLTK